MRFTALLPMACAIAAFVLSMFCLFAGHKAGFMEDYHIMAVGYDLLLVHVPATNISYSGEHLITGP